MQALDTTIANVSLPYIQGSVAANQDEIEWVLTSYIVAAAIMTQPTGYLAERFGVKRLFLTSIVGFTIASMLCGMADSLVQIVFFRLIQGAFGAALVPLSQAVLLNIYPKERQGSGDGVLGHGHHDRPDHRPGARRLADLELQLALGLLHQCADRHSRIYGNVRYFFRETTKHPENSTGSALPC